MPQRKRATKTSRGERKSSAKVTLTPVEKALITRTYFGAMHRARLKRFGGPVKVRFNREDD